jgi:hypothetical protein
MPSRYARFFSIAVVTVVTACSSAGRGPATAGVQERGASTQGLGVPDVEENGGAQTGEDEDEGETGTSVGTSACPPDMVEIEGYCIDRYEASLVEMLPDGTETPYPHYATVDGKEVRAVSVPGVYPQGFISEVQAADACAASGKRLCTYAEWKTACKGPARTTFPYGEARASGVCNDSGRSAVVAVFGARAVLASAIPASAVRTTHRPSAGASRANAAKTGRPKDVMTKRAAKTVRERPKRDPKPKADAPAHTTRRERAERRAKPLACKKPARMSVRPASVEANVWTRLNDPRLGQVEGALAKSGEHPDCSNGYGVVDMVGNLHEWVATSPSSPNGTFAGGYYLDTSQNGDGCNYRTVAHAHEYHDYSTGFRCCADARAERDEQASLHQGGPR